MMARYNKHYCHFRCTHAHTHTHAHAHTHTNIYIYIYCCTLTNFITVSVKPKTHITYIRDVDTEDDASIYVETHVVNNAR
jgi:hypothetical protein